MNKVRKNYEEIEIINKKNEETELKMEDIQVQYSIELLDIKQKKQDNIKYDKRINEMTDNSEFCYFLLYLLLLRILQNK